jgi:hypothetical protein
LHTNSVFVYHKQRKERKKFQERGIKWSDAEGVVFIRGCQGFSASRNLFLFKKLNANTQLESKLFSETYVSKLNV